MRIGLFVTCLTDTLFPDTGKAVVTVLERLGHQVDFPAGQGWFGAAGGAEPDLSYRAERSDVSGGPHGAAYPLCSVAGGGG